MALSVRLATDSISVGKNGSRNSLFRHTPCIGRNSQLHFTNGQVDMNSFVYQRHRRLESIVNQAYRLRNNRTIVLPSKIKALFAPHRAGGIDMLNGCDVERHIVDGVARRSLIVVKLENI